MKFSRSLAIAAIPLIAVLTSCSSGSHDSHDDTIKIGTTEASDRSWEIFESKAADAGITLDVVSFSDYTQPNTALSQGQIDVNLFQHLQFLGEYNVSAGDTLTPIGATQIVPLGLYSQKHRSLADIPQGGEIAIPNDPSNQARALFVLKGAGLLKLSGDTASPTPADIDAGSSKVKVTPVDAAQTALSLASVDGAIINNTFLERSGIDPESALYKDDPSSPAAEPYINAFVTRAEDKNNEKYLELVKIWHDPEIQAAVREESKGTAVEVERDGAQLEQILSRVQDGIRARK